MFAKKSFGQHFLIDGHVINQIVALLNPKPGEVLIEIGPGLGALTVPVLERVNHLIAIELDERLIPKLIKQTSKLGELEIYSVDVLSVDLAKFSDGQIRVFGNLPYQISTPLLFNLLTSTAKITDMLFMLQLELVDRICAGPGSKKYGRISVMLQRYFLPYKCFVVPPFSFNPVPAVSSAIIRLTPHSRYKNMVSQDTFAHLVKAAFSKRRKLLTNSLSGLIECRDLIALGIDTHARAEDLSVGQFIALSRYYDAKFSL